MKIITKNIYVTMLVGVFIFPFFIHAQTYKESFAARLTGADAASSTASTMTGDAILNVFTDESQIDYSVNFQGSADISDIILECATSQANGPTVALLYHNDTPTAGVPTSTVGSLFTSNIYGWASTCQTSISTVPQLAQALRDGIVYINVQSVAHPLGEIRGLFVATSTTTLPSGDGGANGTTTSTSTPSTGGETATSTSTSTPSTTTDSETTDDSDTSSSTPFPGGRRRPVVFATNSGLVLGAFSGPASCSVHITDYIFPGSKMASSIIKLQEFLNKEMNAGLMVTGTFDAPTVASVKTFQNKYANEILTPWVNKGLLEKGVATGLVYKTTLHKINTLSCPGFEEPTPVV